MTELLAQHGAEDALRRHLAANMYENYTNAQRVLQNNLEIERKFVRGEVIDE